MKKKRVVQLALIFLVGIFLGAALGRWSVRFHHPYFGPPGKRIERKMKYLTRKLDLTHEQQAQVRGILEEKRAKMEAFRKEWGPRKKGLKQETMNQIRALLTEDQLDDFAEIEAHVRRHHKKHWFNPKP